ncbi:MAG TPA: FIST N-terminal domain-containing protein [Gemmataceae bacterium]|nr:FIST N-terminal domain-containing protein [Gemmataceae bacterium]
MPFAAALSTEANSRTAFEALCTQTLKPLGGPPDLALAFYSNHHRDSVADLVKQAAEILQPRCLLGCPGEAIVGNGREVEDGPALSLWLGRWTKGVTLTPFHLAHEPTPEGHSIMGWPYQLSEAADPSQQLMLLLADPYTFPVDPFLKEMNEAHRGVRVMGGMASGVRGEGQCRMMLGNRVVTDGAVGVLLQGALGVRGVVSQGCRPIGKHMIVTRARDNIILELSGKPPLTQLQAIWEEVSPHDRELMRRGLHVGRVINEYKSEFQRGDFLIRNVIGLDSGSGALAITDRVRVGQTVQFQVRDAESADEDLHELLQIDLSAHEAKPAGALLFTCNGRGTRLFPQPDHDAGVIRTEAGELPLAGFFAQGELGPIGGQNFIHGFTASVVLFEE